MSFVKRWVKHMNFFYILKYVSCLMEKCLPAYLSWWWNTSISQKLYIFKELSVSMIFQDMVAYLFHILTYFSGLSLSI
jgi:hypothetical protein